MATGQSKGYYRVIVSRKNITDDAHSSLQECLNNGYMLLETHVNCGYCTTFILMKPKEQS